MTDKEILQGIDRLDDELPFDEVCVWAENSWQEIDVHELLCEIRERIGAWHYPSKGEYPTESGDFLCCFYGLTSFKVGWYDKKDQSWCFDSRIIYPKNGADNIIAWQYIIPPKEEV